MIRFSLLQRQTDSLIILSKSKMLSELNVVNTIRPAELIHAPQTGFQRCPVFV